MIARRAAWLVLCAACTTPDIVVGDLQDATALRAIPSRELDVLFVIDDSPSMADKQAALAETFPRMIDKLAQLDGGVPDLHIGVITTDLGTLGSAVGEPGPPIGVLGNGGCSGRGDDGVLQHAAAPELTAGFVTDASDATGGRLRNYDGELRDVVSRLVQVGAGGCGFEQPLAAMRRALDNPANAELFRPGANLAVVILSDEDDCSMLDPALLGPDAALGPLQSFRCFEQGVRCEPDEPRALGDKHGCTPRSDAALVEPVEPFIAALLAAKPDPRQVMVAAIVGDPAPVAVELAALPGTGMAPRLAPACRIAGATGDETADPAVRLAAFVDGFAGKRQLTSICDRDLGSALDAIGATAKQMVGDPCIDTRALIDSSELPGVQPACDVTSVRDADPDRPQPVVRCASADASDCYTIVADPVACPAGDDHLRIRMQRPTTPTSDSWIHVRCQRTIDR